MHQARHFVRIPHRELVTVGAGLSRLAARPASQCLIKNGVAGLRQLCGVQNVRVLVRIHPTFNVASTNVTVRTYYSSSLNCGVEEQRHSPQLYLSSLHCGVKKRHSSVCIHPLHCGVEQRYPTPQPPFELNSPGFWLSNNPRRRRPTSHHSAPHIRTRKLEPALATELN